MKLEGKKVLVVGAGKSGIAASELLLDKKIETVLYDGNKDLDVEKLYEKAPKLKGMPVLLGELTDEQLRAFDVAVLSPGVPTDLPVVERMRAQNVCIWGEIELAYSFAKGRLIAITGTNGKTTTTALTGEIMKNYFKDVRVVGNIGIPYTSEAATMTDETVTVAEISSFQLETIHEFHPQISAILNITPDHLNRHHTMECYIRTKEAITTNQTNDEVCVLNYEDEVLRAFGESAPVHVVWFSSARKLAEGFYLDGEEIFYAHDGNTEKVINVNDLNLLGRHNYENVMAATAMSVNFGVPMEKIVEVLKRFQAVEHRIEYVTEKRGVRFYNDSKGTNPDAAIQGIRAMNRPTLLIGGGYDKQSTYDEWIDAFDGKVKKLVLIGQTAEKIEVCAHKHGFMDTVRCETFEEAIRYCYDHAVSGDAVLLSPACASWGMFPNYEERGRIFKEIVRGLDYYTKTVFEFVNEDGFTLCGGGRYDNLVHEIDGKVSMPSVGFGMGVERILYFLEEEKVDLPCTRDIDLYVGILGQEAKAKAYQIVVDLRNQGFVVETDYLGRSVKAQMKYANKLNAKNTIIIGDDELAKNEGNVKNMETREVTTISLDKIADCLK